MPRKKRSASPFELMDDDFDDNSSQSSRNGNPPIQRNAANARERARMRVLSSAFGRLKTKLPNIPADTKLSKLDTLRLATMYIKQLKSVVEEASASGSQIANGEIIDGSSLNINANDATNCYLNTGVQSMNWPFGFHHHIASSSLIRSSSANNLINSSSSHNNNNNWCQNNEEQVKHARYDENYEHYNHHQQQQQQTIHHNTTLNQQNNHWYSETPSPELDSSSSTCLTFENSHLQQRTEHYPHIQRQNNNNHHHHNMSHLSPVTSHSSAFNLQHDFHHQPSSASLHQHHLQQNRFVNSTNFQSTSIR